MSEHIKTDEKELARSLVKGSLECLVDFDLQGRAHLEDGNSFFLTVEAAYQSLGHPAVNSENFSSEEWNLLASYIVFFNSSFEQLDESAFRQKKLSSIEINTWVKLFTGAEKLIKELDKQGWGDVKPIK